MVDTVSALLRTYVFQDLSPAELEGIAPACKTVSFGAGEHVFRVGDPAEELWILVDGQLKEYVVDRDGNEYVTELMGPGTVFGEPGVFAPGRTRVVNEVTVTPSTLLTIARQPLFKFLLAHPAAMVRFLEGLSAEAQMALPQMVMLAYSSLSGRVIARLLQLAEATVSAPLPGREVELNLSQSMLAAMVGATREKVNRALAPLVSAGLVRLDYRRIVLADVVSLRRIQTAVDLRAHPRHHRESDARQVPNPSGRQR